MIVLQDDVHAIEDAEERVVRLTRQIEELAPRWSLAPVVRAFHQNQVTVPMSELFSLDGKVALVTGASPGLGFAMAEALAAHGAQVILNGRRRDALEAKAATLRERGLRAEVAAFDVTDAAAVSGAVIGIADSHGRLDVLVNNAAIQHRVPITEWQAAGIVRIDCCDHRLGRIDVHRFAPDR